MTPEVTALPRALMNPVVCPRYPFEYALIADQDPECGRRLLDLCEPPRCRRRRCAARQQCCARHSTQRGHAAASSALGHLLHLLRRPSAASRCKYRAQPPLRHTPTSRSLKLKQPPTWRCCVRVRPCCNRVARDTVEFALFAPNPEGIRPLLCSVSGITQQ